ncbi:MAG TPA: sensor histidine kinase [Rudaea sp.]|jgi:two-component system sensor histidine kinase DesK
MTMLFRFNPSDNEIERGRAAGFASVSEMRSYAWLNLVWAVFIPITPLFAADAFPNWFWPTWISLAIFSVLYFRSFHRRVSDTVLWYALAIAALGYLVTPFNSGGQTYLIYACAFLAFVPNLRTAVRLMVGSLVLFAIEWYLLGFPWIYSTSALVVGPVVGGMNLVYRRNQQRNAELKLSHDEVRRLAALAERERIGRDLHDLLGHTLSLITLKSELANRLFERDPLGARREIADVERVARDALAQVRRAVTGIRAAGFAAELASAKLLLESNGVRLDYALAEVALPAEVETVLAMTTREAVTNIQRHAQATRARITLGTDASRLLLRIEDDGRGGAIVPGNGLTGMRERLSGIGAELRVESERGRGTTVSASMPLPKESLVPAPSVQLQQA